MFESIKRDEVMCFSFENFRLIIILEPDLESPAIQYVYTIGKDELNSINGFPYLIINITEHGVW